MKLNTCRVEVIVLSQSEKLLGDGVTATHTGIVGSLSVVPSICELGNWTIQTVFVLRVFLVREVFSHRFLFAQ